MWLEILLVVLALFILLYRYVSKNFGRWEKEGVPCLPASFPCGTHKELLLLNRHLNECMREDYKKMGHHPVHGWYLFGKPALSINDLDVIKSVMVKDFDHFVDRNIQNLQKVLIGGGKYDQIWSRQLTNLEGDDWKDVRSTFSPIFTSGKMKGMVKTIETIGSYLMADLESKAARGADFDLKDVFGKFSLDSLASCTFTVDAESFSDKDSKFVANASRIFQNTAMDMLLLGLKLVPATRAVINFLGISIFKPKPTAFFNDIIVRIIEHRRKTGERRNDLIDMMLDCLNDPSVTSSAPGQGAAGKEESGAPTNSWSQYETDMSLKHKAKTGRVNEDMLVATAIVFLVAGYDTTGMTLSFMAHFLSRHPDVQSRLQEEIDAAYEEAGGCMPDYNTLQALPYLEQVILETLRKQAPIGLLTRVCTKDYQVPGTNIRLKKDDLITIPVLGIQEDPKYFANPEIFDPEHFSKEARSQRNPYAFMPFGQGPRACLGMRFAVLELKVAMAMILRKMTFFDSPKNPEKLVPDPVSQLGYTKNGLWARVQLRKDV